MNKLESIVRDALKNSRELQFNGELFENPRIAVVGCGGAGCNTVNRLAKAGIKGADLIAINTDKQHLNMISDDIRKVLIGPSVTRGLGAGGDPSVGAKAAEVSRPVLEEMLENADLVFVTAGMGGGTGTGSAPVVADIARQQGAIVISMVTYPFALERERIRNAEEGIRKLQQVSDTVIVIDNNRLLQLVPNLPLDQAFAVADEVISKSVKGITETITVPSLMNLDYADIRAVMSNGGVSMISVGEARGHNRVQEAVESTLKNSLLDVDYTGAKGVLIHITGGPDLTLGETNEIGELLTERVDPRASVTWGARIDPEFEGKLQVIAIFTGVQSPYVMGANKDETRAPTRNMDIGIEFLK